MVMIWLRAWLRTQSLFVAQRLLVDPYGPLWGEEGGERREGGGFLLFLETHRILCISDHLSQAWLSAISNLSPS